MGANRIPLKKLIVDGVRNPSQRMPVPLGIRSESPLDCLPGETMLHLRIVEDVAVIVEINECVPGDRVIEGQDAQPEQQADNECAFFRGRKQAVFGKSVASCGLRISRRQYNSHS